MQSSLFLEGLNDAQREAVMHDQGPLLIVAGAGTGKTTVLTRRYAYLIASKNLTTDRVLALTFTDKAAGEMEDRVLELLPVGAYDFWISTFHAFCQRVLEAHALEIGLPNRFRVLSETDGWLLLRRHLRDLPLDIYRPLGNPTKFLTALLKHISRAKDEAITAEQYVAFAREVVLDGDSDEVVQGERRRIQELADLYAAYEHLLRQEGAMDFGGLILETLRLFRERPAILAAYQEQFARVMVDEFQDTNGAQYALLKWLTQKHRHLTVVGDDDQAIYKFRGASLANILQFKDDFPDAKTIALTHNYRSKHEILDCAYAFIRKNDPNRLEVKLQHTGLSKRLQAFRGQGGEVRVIWEKDAEAEAETIVSDIVRRKQAEGSEWTWNDFAILVRANDGAAPFVAACERHGVPYQFLAASGLYVKPVVLDAHALLSVIHDPHNSPAVWRAIQTRAYGLAPEDVAALLHHAKRKGIPLWGAVIHAALGRTDLEISENGRTIARRFVHDRDRLATRAKTDRALKILHAVFQETGYLKELLRLPEAEREEAIQYANAFAARVQRYEMTHPDPGLHGFLEEFGLELESGEDGALQTDPDAGPEFVKIMTVHAAKGLEFAHVCVGSMVDQRFPTRQRGESIPLPEGLVDVRLPEGDGHLEEERRLFYVAMTRAKDSLTFSGATDYGGTRAKRPSVFLEEAGLGVTDLPAEEKRERGRSRASLIGSPDVDRDLQKTSDIRYFSLKKRFSFTQLAAFRKCPLQYKLAHVYRIPILGSYQKSFGQSLHLTFQRMLLTHLARGSVQQGSLFMLQAPGSPVEGFRVTKEEAYAFFEESWIDEWYPDRATHDERKKQGEAAVYAFWRSCQEQVPDVLEVEKDYVLPFGMHTLKAKIDRVDRLPDGRVMVVDYKTGIARETLEKEDREQLYLYQICLEQRGLTVGRLVYQYVLEGKIIDVEPLDGKDREAFIAEIQMRMDEIVQSDFPAKPSPHVCKYCDFQAICEFRK